MRCTAYVIPAEAYQELEAQILEGIRDGERQQLLYLLEENEHVIELLSGEWRSLFKVTADFFQYVDVEERVARMAISPEELPDFVAELSNPERLAAWQPICFGLLDLVRALPEGSQGFGVVFVEESDDWMWVEHPYELMALRPAVFELIMPHIREQIESGDHAVLARLMGDHCEGSVEFARPKWETLIQHARLQVPELEQVVQNMIAMPQDYEGIRAAIASIADAKFQPSLDAWLRVHGATANYALYFRNVERERE